MGEGPVVTMAYDAQMGHAVRDQPWNEQGQSSYVLARRALTDGDFANAAALGRYTVEEASEGQEVYAAWADQIRAYLVDEGIAQSVLADEETRLAELLKNEDGTDFDAWAGWAHYTNLIERFVFACGASDAAAASRLLDEAHQTWRVTHDRGCDLVYGLLDVVVRHLGEDRIGPLWDALMAPMFTTYDRYDTKVNPWPQSMHRLILVAAESLRGHLSGPDRNGSVEITEEEDRWALRFAPCGTGGRTYEPDEKGHARMEAPYNFAVTTEEHDWAWNEKGICVYCVHCCTLNQRLPMARFGYPTRVIDPPRWPEARKGGNCTWYVYKDPSLVPDAAYSAVGMERPKTL